MKDNYLFLFIFLLSFQLFSREKYPERDDFEFVSKTPNDQIKVGKCKIIIEVSGIQDVIYQHPIIWSVDKEIDTTYLNDNSLIESELKYGKHEFKFFYSKQYKEIITRKIEFESGYTYLYRLNFKDTERNMQVKKPVIYIYPTQKMELNVNVYPKGSMVFTYPILPKDGWNIEVDENGKIHFNGNSYRYLFWEAEDVMKRVEYSSGFIVSGDQALAFLEDKLSAIGLTSEERADMITFWGPELQKNMFNFIKFSFNEECNEFADLSIEPRPDHLFRVYLTYFSMQDLPEFKITEQDLPKFNREGFHVLEWGGVELKSDFISIFKRK